MIDDLSFTVASLLRSFVSLVKILKEKAQALGYSHFVMYFKNMFTFCSSFQNFDIHGEQ